MQQLVIVNGSASDQNRIITLATTWKSISTRHIFCEIFVKESAELMAMVVPELTHLIMDMPLIARDHHRDFSLLFRTTMTLV